MQGRPPQLALDLIQHKLRRITPPKVSRQQEPRRQAAIRRVPMSPLVWLESMTLLGTKSRILQNRWRKSCAATDAVHNIPQRTIPYTC